MEAMQSMYPVTIIMARYGGIYEGGVWLAFNCYEDEVPAAATSNDISCVTFFGYAADSVGRGDTPNKALADLRGRIIVQRSENELNAPY